MQTISKVKQKKSLGTFSLSFVLNKKCLYYQDDLYPRSRERDDLHQMPVSTTTPRKTVASHRTDQGICWAWARVFTLHWECTGLDSADSSGKIQELAKRNSSDPFSCSLKWTSGSNFPALMRNWNGFVPGQYLNGAHPTGNLPWDSPCEIRHCNRLMTLETSLDSHHGLAFNLRFPCPALPPTLES